MLLRLELPLHDFAACARPEAFLFFSDSIYEWGQGALQQLVTVRAALDLCCNSQDSQSRNRSGRLPDGRSAL